MRDPGALLFVDPLLFYLCYFSIIYTYLLFLIFYKKGWQVFCVRLNGPIFLDYQ